MTSKELRRLPVHTASGQYLGRVVGFSFDPEHHIIVQYWVSRGVVLLSTLTTPLLVHRSQVQSLSTKGMIVDDAVSQENVKTPVVSRQTRLAQSSTSALQRSLESDS